MKVLFPWLREFVPIEEDPPVLAERLSLAGLAVERVEGDLLDLDLTSNRPDWLSHYGVAREIAAVTGQALKPLGAHVAISQAISGMVRIDEPTACGRYCALVLEGVRVADSPAAVAERLNQLGHRAINNIADLTNYTLWEMGHPTHAFDADQLRGGAIRVRFARAGETLVTLDEIERKLDPADLVIADAERPVALAGVMGGLETAISPKTTRVVLESAWFDPLTVRRTARRHGLHTDASHRFERGADPEAAPLAAALIAARAQSYGATLVGGLMDARGELPRLQPIPLRAATLERILGKEVNAAERQRLLLALGCQPVPGGWLAPSWRPDLTREIDLIEEIARLHGYERFPARLPAFAGTAAPLPEAGLRDRIRQQLRGRGFAEAVTISFASEQECGQFTDSLPVRVLNPLSEEAAILRTSSLPAMLHLLRYNLNHDVAAPKLFEIGKVYSLSKVEPEEKAVLSLGACDPGLEFLGFKGEVEAVLAAFATGPLTCTPAGARCPYLHPGRSAAFETFAVFGQISPELAAIWKVPPETWLAEIRLDSLYKKGSRPVQYSAPPRYPASERDFSFIFEDAVAWAKVESALLHPPIPALVSVSPAEIFREPPIPAGHYSLLVRARFQSEERTLRDDEVQAGADEITRRLRQLGGQQR